MFKGSKNVEPEAHTSFISVGRRPEQRLHDRRRDGVLGDGAGAVPAAGAVARSRPDGDAAHRRGHVRHEREVVKEERRMRVDNQPYGRLNEIIYDHAFTTHPYKHPTIGSMADLEAASIEDVRDFYATYYVPENATLTLVGDFDTAQAKQLVKQYFGRVPKAERPVPRDIPKEPPQTEGAPRHARAAVAAAGGRRRVPHHLRRPPRLVSAAHRRRRCCPTARARGSTRSWSTNSSSRSPRSAAPT